ncbi:bifunctional phosphopantothenoylcysteine decarboxylase/phosphopantothenate--cysteine ligase CoaBC [Desulfallas sp. Bu1-1]|uniref:bifunctional phosphopantothenoylcysteine decarboxylase/phosphopantothenate--cysteine ligase CoaBC n=1 Tax=Desulfallas sp. Bu1-1 TaxID=2787620 RepID=UPI00189ED1BB|nr:bifunctional phosphopantothenoylcysteine decarboxylase/phosphopantothenate--cysteine ligase CoaBC [Desulfallas sp. Bu1-1]MBF7082316.1 bifunctional phosphopantothenoylcysteine decarboxylase/phosphopantothenate--cysteine ligase CoaBC [Desulfallas sp. Bu1-1]
MLKGKHIVIGVTGGIAAHRALDLASNLVKAGVEVHVIMTAGAREFIRPLAFEAISGNRVHVDTFKAPPGWRYPHLELARRADLAVIVPATANILAKLACGMADDLLTTTVLAMVCPVLVCPAMNAYMYRNQAVQENLSCLRRRGFIIVEPSVGRQACGDEGPGRLADVAVIMERIGQVLDPPKGDLAGITALVTAGGTREPIDPVRYISNRSSGKMGYALARAAANRGAGVYLVSGPTNLEPPEGVKLVHVETAAEMFRAVMELYPRVDVVVKAAAVADYRPRVTATQKIKKEDDGLVLELEKNVDILLELGKNKRHQLLVGFAAETEDLINNARRKLVKKNLDMLVANDVMQPGAGFGTDTNIAKLIFPDGRIKSLPLMDKLELSDRIWDEVLQLRANAGQKDTAD